MYSTLFIEVTVLYVKYFFFSFLTLDYKGIIGKLNAYHEDYLVRTEQRLHEKTKRRE